MREKLRSLVTMYVLICLIGAYLTFMRSFLRAWLQPNKMITIAINQFGEGDLELLSLLIVGGLLPFAFYYILKDSIQAERWRNLYE